MKTLRCKYKHCFVVLPFVAGLVCLFVMQATTWKGNVKIAEMKNRTTTERPRSFNHTLAEHLHQHLMAYQIRSLPGMPECPHNNTLEDIFPGNEYIRSGNKSWHRFYRLISSCELYTNDELVDELLGDLTTSSIENVEYLTKGTQVKLKLTFTNGLMALFRPMLFPREQEADDNHFYFTYDERHYAEIATFHLDRILGFHRALPTVGRVLNVAADLKDKAEEDLKKTFYFSPVGNLCFLPHDEGDTRHAVCARATAHGEQLLEGAVQMFLPDEALVPRRHNVSPYRRTYSKSNPDAVWQTDNTYCSRTVKKKRHYTNDRRLLDLIDFSILDFLIGKLYEWRMSKAIRVTEAPHNLGNQDRHSFESFKVFNNSIAYPLHMDHGCAFGHTDFDDIDIIKPLIQCCVIRPSTLKRLLEFYAGSPSLTESLERSMSKDPVAPILAPKHYPAIERRLETILFSVENCLSIAGDSTKVIMKTYLNPEVPDGFDSDEFEQ